MRDLASEVSEGSALIVIARSLIQRLQYEGHDNHLINEVARIRLLTAMGNVRSRNEARAGRYIDCLLTGIC
jgi:hypothetical protein